jgi:serine protease
MIEKRIIAEFESIEDREKYIEQLDVEYKLLDNIFIGIIHKETHKVRSLGMVKMMQEDQSVIITQNEDIITDCGVYWHLDRISQRKLPLNKIYQYKRNTMPVHVYVMDTGINHDHPEFGCRVKRVFNTYQETNVNVNFDHGTHVAGSIAGITTGVNKYCKVYDVKVLDNNGNGYLSDLLLGMDWIKKNHIKPAVVNMSLSTKKTTFMNTAIKSLYDSNIIMVTAAGNENDNACNYSPASSQYVITVGSSTINDERSEFSNYGDCVDIYAPGSDIVSTSFNNRLTTKSGTSMSCAIVSGVISIILQEQPSYTSSQVKLRLIANATKDINRNIVPFVYKPIEIMEKDLTSNILESKSSEIINEKPKLVKKKRNVSHTFIHM